MTGKFSRRAIAVAAGMLMLCAIGVSAQPAGSGAEKTLTGIVSDAMCGKTHAMKGETPAQCTRMCVKGGSAFALVVGDKVYTLRGSSSSLYKYAGQKVILKGTMQGDTVLVESVAPAK